MKVRRATEQKIDQYVPDNPRGKRSADISHDGTHWIAIAGAWTGQFKSFNEALTWAKKAQR